MLGYDPSNDSAMVDGDRESSSSGSSDRGPYMSSSLSGSAVAGTDPR